MNIATTHAVPEYLTVKQLGARIQRAPKTIYNLIAEGKFGLPEGFHRLNGGWLVEWEVFRRRVLSGRAF